ncbi:RdgB/HAM1 family non-canonical purine NTP pyrophosphatase [Telluribacter sp.]|jgi:XTP/dITP diphosphohydrolase|uniref:RdgB/HAM1 family non-canonical purine NTP pyrophosphatase n=1 Tax=Telluribacter sp. TaxID=1978767 RepID=UPI002E151081|nr:RdgB/HAM1 family non-canonical purine NTP pyrophosphatase [Telluribacter sp.]
MELCFATNNTHKLTEIQALLGQEFQLRTLRDIGCDEDIPETHDTIAANSREKAELIWEQYRVNAFADDTGLEVYALGGEPGVYSARYAGPQRNADDNMQLLWERLADKPDRRARFITIITLVLDGRYHQFEGMVEGTIIQEKRGTHGFGYDPIFVPEGHNRTFAEMSLSEKSKLSHRARAFARLAEFLKIQKEG